MLRSSSATASRMGWRKETLPCGRGDWACIYWGRSCMVMVSSSLMVAQRLHKGAQLADVARPAVGQEAVQHLRIEIFLQSAFFDDLLQKMHGEDRNVVRPFPQGRDFHGQHPEAVEEVFAELPGSSHVGQRLVGGGDDPHVHGDGLVPPTLWKGCPSSTCSSLACMGRGELAVSSRRRVPLVASSNMPGLPLLAAPVKAPFS